MTLQAVVYVLGALLIALGLAVVVVGSLRR